MSFFISLFAFSVCKMCLTDSTRDSNPLFTEQEWYPTSSVRFPILLGQWAFSMFRKKHFQRWKGSSISRPIQPLVFLLRQLTIVPFSDCYNYVVFSYSHFSIGNWTETKLNVHNNSYILTICSQNSKAIHMSKDLWDWAHRQEIKQILLWGLKSGGTGRMAALSTLTESRGEEEVWQERSGVPFWPC